MTEELAVDGSLPRPEGLLKWYSFNVHWWDSGVVFGPAEGNPGGKMDVWARGNDYADAAANAIRFVEKLGHWVDSVASNL
jgi:hypothetical protein